MNECESEVGGSKIHLWFKDEKTQLFKLCEYTVWV